MLIRDVVADDLESVRTEAAINALIKSKSVTVDEMFVQGYFCTFFLALGAFCRQQRVVIADVFNEIPENVEDSAAEDAYNRRNRFSALGLHQIDFISLNSHRHIG